MSAYLRVPCVLILIWLIVNCVRSTNGAEDPIVTLKYGKVKGRILQSTGGRDYFAFRGIPYAKPPIDDLRFKPPQKTEPWKGIWDATQDGSECPQLAFITRDKFLGNENCLFLNVYTPKLNSGSELPVFVFIHGGGFYFGSGSSAIHGAKKHMDHDVVLVTVNYRLGVLGFLSTEDKEAPGNYGMLDQVEALHWVQENIATFSGNPKKVLLHGLSAGGASVTYHFLSPLSKGLFHTVIAQSGTTLSHWTFQKKPLFWAKRIAEKLNYPTNSTFEMVEYFKKENAETLVRASYSLQLAEFLPMYLTPVVDYPHGNGFLTDDPLVLLKEGKIENKAVPFITGITRDEGVFFYKTMFSSNLSEAKIKDFLDHDFANLYLQHLVDLPIDRLAKSAKIIRNEYFGSTTTITVAVFEEIFSKFLADALMNIGADRTLQYLSKAGVTTYAYKYSYQSKEGLMVATKLASTEDNVISHADELSMQFGFSPLPGNDITSNVTTNAKMTQLLHTLWKNFALTGLPSFSGFRLGNQTIKWTPYDAAGPNYFEINIPPAVRTGTLSKKTQFWTKKLLLNVLQLKEEL